MGRVAWALLGLLFGGCSAAVETIGPPIGPAALEDSKAIMRDGAILPLRSYLPDQPPEAIILALHGFNDYSRAFEAPGAFFAQHGIALYAYDQRGFGAAPSPGQWFGTATLDDDVRSMAALLRAKYPGKKLFLLGESMGGAIALTAMTSATPPDVDGVILSAPAVWARETQSVFQRAGLFVFSHALAWMPLSGSGFAITPSDNEPMLRALSADPLVRKRTSVSTLTGLVNLMDDALIAAPQLTAPALYLIGERDEIVPASASCLMLSRLEKRPPAEWRVAFYPVGYHMLLRDLEAELVLTDVAAWIKNRRAELPSGDEVLTGDDNRRHAALQAQWLCHSRSEP
jgi:alpha-beta hydrolase superfamily lysophospholipase